MFLSLALVLILGVIGGYIFEKIKLPKLIYYLILGVLLSPSLIGGLDEKLLNISSELRQIALVIILTRSGLSLDLKSLKQVGRPAILLCFLPATFEIIGVTLISYFIFDFKITEGLLLGSVLAAVSPAIVVPRMIKYNDLGYSKEKKLPLLVMSGSSCDDIYVIVLFYVFKQMVDSGKVDGLQVLMIPVSIILGIILGIVMAILLLVSFKYLKLNKTIKTLLMLGVSFLMIYIESVLKNYVSISSLLGIIVMAMVILFKDKESTVELKDGYNKLWVLFELLLFVLVGAKIDLDYVFSITGLKVLLVLAVGLMFRTVGTYLSILGMNYNWKEKLFVIISYIPKATVQASIGAIALNDGLACGNIVLTAAFLAILITAPIGGILIDKLTPKLLEN